MYFTFSKEPSYGEDTTSQDYVVDLLSEEIVDNINYAKTIEFNHPTSRGRFKTVKTVEGSLGFDLTYDNEAWNILFEVLVGKRIRLTGVVFSKTIEKWNILTSMLSTDINSSETSFAITEYTSGDFDHVDGIIINNEYIEVIAISDGIITTSIRASKGTTAFSHIQSALVYGVENSGSKNIDLIYRYQDGFSFFLPTSLTCIVYRDGEYFEFPGSKFSNFIFNAKPIEGISSTFKLRGQRGGIVSLLNPVSTEDNEFMVSTHDVNCYSMGEGYDIEKFYFQINNSLDYAPPGFLSNTHQSLVLKRFSTYGQFTLIPSNLDAYDLYINDSLRNLSMTICDDKHFENVFIFAFNEIRYGTMMHVLRSTRLISDSVPFYVYGPSNFTIMIQN